MKKFISIMTILVVILSISCIFIGCEPKEETTISVVVPDGTPALAIAKLMDDFTTFTYKNVKYDINYEIVSGASEIAAKVAGGKADIAIMPTNAAANLYNKGTKIGLIASNIYGSLYMIGNTEINSFDDLKSKKIAYTGQGGTPEYIMRYVLENNGINVDEDLTATAVSSGSEALAMIKQNTAFAAVVGEPVASMAKKQGIKVIMDFQEEYLEITGENGYPQASTVATQDLIDNHSALLKEFVVKMEENLTYITTESSENVTASLQNNGSAVTFPTTESITNSNVKVVKAMDAKAGIVSYFEITGQFNATFYGGQLPDDGFYANIE